MNPLLTIKQLKKTYSSPQPIDLLKDISFCVHEKESVAIMGASGEGKTTLLHILASLEKPSSGEILFQDKSLSEFKVNEYRLNQIGFIFQTYNLIEDLSVLENVLLPMRLKKDINLKRAELLLQELGLTHRSSFLTKHLSGGEKQRVAIARAFANDPPLILADEPTGNLDHTNAEIVHDFLINCTKKFQKTLIVATHNQDLANRCQMIYQLTNGIIQLKSK
jgi:ABC-type lipoprotein export system ATPase subunit